MVQLIHYCLLHMGCNFISITFVFFTVQVKKHVEINKKCLRNMHSQYYLFRFFTVFVLKLLLSSMETKIKQPVWIYDAYTVLLINYIRKRRKKFRIEMKSVCLCTCNGFLTLSTWLEYIYQLPVEIFLLVWMMMTLICLF